MKKANIILALACSLIFLGCKKSVRNISDDKTEDVVSLHDDYEETEKVNVSAESDSLYPVNTYTFLYTDESFPSVRKQHLALISGFETDGHGRFYIAGGKPIRLVCYNGIEPEYDIILSNAESNRGIMKLCEDTILFVEESTMSLAKVSKDGTGAVEHYPLPIEAKDSIVDGWIGEDSLYLTLYDTKAKCESHEDHIRNTHKCTILLSDRCVTSNSVYEPYPYLSDTSRGILEYDRYYGINQSMHFFYRYDQELTSWGRVSLVDKKGNLANMLYLAGLSPLPTCCCSHKIEGEYPTHNLYRLRDNHFFMSTYDRDKGTITIMDYDLDPLYSY